MANETDVSDGKIQNVCESWVIFLLNLLFKTAKKQLKHKKAQVGVRHSLLHLIHYSIKDNYKHRHTHAH